MLKKGSILLLGLLLTAACANECAAQSKKLRTIVVDAGHGGIDAGAVGQYENSLRSKEKDVTLGISMKLVAELKKQLPDVKIIPTRTTDIYDPVTEKAKIANEAKGDLFLCIHADSGPLQTGRRQIGTKMVTRYKISYTGKGKRRKKHSTPYEVEEPVYEYFKMPLKARGTTVYIFAAHKTSDKLKAIMKGMDADDMIGDDGTTDSDSTLNNVDFSAPEYHQLAQIYAKLYQEKSDRIAGYVNDEIDATGRPALGVNQRQKGFGYCRLQKCPQF